MKPSAAHQLRYGHLVLNREKLDSAGKKAQLRAHLWAYRFWRAGHDQDVRRAQVALAMSRVATFYDKPIPGRKGKAIGDFISSEYGVALLLDEHVNRPGHVPKILMEGIDRFVANSNKNDPVKWSDADEAAALKEYLAKRATSGMTDSSGRAKKIAAFVESGMLSVKRGSFVQDVGANLTV